MTNDEIICIKLSIKLKQFLSFFFVAVRLQQALHDAEVIDAWI